MVKMEIISWKAHTNVKYKDYKITEPENDLGWKGP